MGIVRAKRPSGLELCHAFCDAAINDGLRFEYDLTVFRGRLEHISDGDADLVTHVLRDDHLKLVFDGHDSHGFVVEQFNCSLSL